jgi:hypothetical protein
MGDIKVAVVNSVSNVEKSNINAKATNKTTKSYGTSFDSYLGESSSMDKIFDKAADKYDVPVELLKAIGKQESNFNAKAVSRCGAQGVMQLMPATARSLGVTNSYDAEQNIMGGAKYISSLLKKYDGDVKLALAAYNAGSGNVAKYGGIPPFKETQNYVKKVVGYMKNKDVSGVSNYMSPVNNTSSKDNSTVTSTNNANTTTTNTSNTTDATNSSSTLNSTSSTTSEYANITSVEDILNNTSENLDDIFTYDDYLRFLTQFLEEEKENKSDENAAFYASKQLNYSIPVVNLLNTGNL